MRLCCSILAAALVVLAGGGCDRSDEVPPPEVSVASLDPTMADLVRRSRDQVMTNRASAEAWGRLGQVYHTLEFMTEARVCYERAGALAPQSAKWPHLLGLTRLQDDPEAALILLRQAADRAGNNPDSPRVRLAQALVERGRSAEAEPLLQELLAGDPAHPMAHLELGRLSLSRLELDRAAMHLGACVSNRFTRRPALLLLGQVRQRQGDAAAAAELIRDGTAMERPLDWPDPYLAEVQSLRVDRQQSADRINALLMRGQLGEAAEGLNRLLAAAPNDPEGLLLLGRLRYLEKRCPEAEEILRQHLALQTNSLNGLMQLSLALLCQERWADAATSLRRVLALKPEFGAAHANLGFALARSGDSEGAIRSYREALRVHPGDVGSHLALAEELGIVGRPDEGLAQLERASALAPTDPRIERLRERLRRR